MSWRNEKEPEGVEEAKRMQRTYYRRQFTAEKARKQYIVGWEFENFHTQGSSSFLFNKAYNAQQQSFHISKKNFPLFFQAGEKNPKSRRYWLRTWKRSLAL